MDVSLVGGGDRGRVPPVRPPPSPAVRPRGRDGHRGGEAPHGAHEIAAAGPAGSPSPARRDPTRALRAPDRAPKGAFSPVSGENATLATTARSPARRRR